MSAMLSARLTCLSSKMDLRQYFFRLVKYKEQGELSYHKDNCRPAMIFAKHFFFAGRKTYCRKSINFTRESCQTCFLHRWQVSLANGLMSVFLSDQCDIKNKERNSRLYRALSAMLCAWLTGLSSQLDLRKYVFWPIKYKERTSICSYICA